MSVEDILEKRIKALEDLNKRTDELIEKVRKIEQTSGTKTSKGTQTGKEKRGTG